MIAGNMFNETILVSENPVLAMIIQKFGKFIIIIELRLVVSRAEIHGNSRI